MIVISLIGEAELERKRNDALSFDIPEAHGLVSDGRIQSHGRGGTEIGR